MDKMKIFQSLALVMLGVSLAMAFEVAQQGSAIVPFMVVGAMLVIAGHRIERDS
jgi:DMSO reductase anchor subunit